MKPSKKISFAAILSTLSFIVMLIGCFAQTVTLSAAAVASLFVAIALKELGIKYSLTVYATSSALAFILLPSKEPLLYFLCFFGYYPVIKILVERFKPVINYLLKWLSLTLSYALIALIFVKIIAPEAQLLKYVFILYPAVLAVFLLFDRALSKLIKYYAFTLRKKLKIDKYLA